MISVSSAGLFHPGLGNLYRHSGQVLPQVGLAKAFFSSQVLKHAFTTPKGEMRKVMPYEVPWLRFSWCGKASTIYVQQERFGTMSRVTFRVREQPATASNVWL